MTVQEQIHVFHEGLKRCKMQGGTIHQVERKLGEHFKHIEGENVHERVKWMLSHS